MHREPNSTKFVKPCFLHKSVKHFKIYLLFTTNLLDTTRLLAEPVVFVGTLDITFPVLKTVCDVGVVETVTLLTRSVLLKIK